MILCLDIGNTHIFGGLYEDGILQIQFRYPSSTPSTSDQLGVFLKAVLNENNLNSDKIKKVAICSVVPSLNYTIRAAFLKYFKKDPFFLDMTSSKFKTTYPNPQEIGADRISIAIAAKNKYPREEIIVIDFGTATTFDVISKNENYLGGVIIPGLYISMKALYENTAKLSAVDIIKPETILGHSTTTNIQSGLYYSHLGAVKEMIHQITKTTFAGRKPIIIGTGGFAYLFENEHIYNEVIPELVLEGLYIAVNYKDAA